MFQLLLSVKLCYKSAKVCPPLSVVSSNRLIRWWFLMDLFYSNFKYNDLSRISVNFDLLKWFLCLQDEILWKRFKLDLEINFKRSVKIILKFSWPEKRLGWELSNGEISELFDVILKTLKSNLIVFYKIS